jgi:hypothetical protein
LFAIRVIIIIVVFCPGSILLLDRRVPRTPFVWLENGASSLCIAPVVKIKGWLIAVIGGKVKLLISQGSQKFIKRSFIIYL